MGTILFSVDRSTNFRRELIQTVGGGVVAAAVFGLYATNRIPEWIGYVGLLYGFPGNMVIGWAAHLLHGMVFAGIFVLLGQLSLVRTASRSLSGGAALGLVFGIVIWLVASFLIPVWINSVSSLSAPVPWYQTRYLEGHIVYGVILGSLFSHFSRQSEE